LYAFKRKSYYTESIR